MSIAIVRADDLHEPSMIADPFPMPRARLSPDRAAIGAKFKAFHTGPDATWDKALYDRVQAIK